MDQDWKNIKDYNLLNMEDNIHKNKADGPKNINKIRLHILLVLNDRKDFFVSILRCYELSAILESAGQFSYA